VKEFLSDLPIKKAQALAVGNVPVSYNKLVELLKQEKKTLATGKENLVTIDWKQFKKLAISANVAPNDIEGVAKFLHDTGVIVHFHEKKSALDNLIILNPQALVRIVGVCRKVLFEILLYYCSR
jgi:hypothetical protein